MRLKSWEKPRDKSRKRTKKGKVYEVIGKKEMVTYLSEKGIKNPEKILLRFVGKLSSFSQNKM